jgi:TolB-like protein/Flp pilus assembly protein TadD
MPSTPPSPANAADRLDSWKEIASYLRRDVRTVQRWEKKESLPVYRHQHDKLGSVYAFRPELDAWFSSRLQATSAGHALEPDASEGKLKLAVLPFGNLNSDPEQDYFSDGLTEEMITQITRLQPKHLTVIALSTAMHYKASNKPLEQIKNELGVDYILQGRVRRANDRVRITAQLIEVEDQTNLWAETYERDLRDILSVQADIAESIAKEIHVLVNRPAAPATERRVNPAAYENYLKGRFHLHGMTPVTIKKSIDFFERAIVEDPNHAPSHAAVADAYGLLAIAPFDLLPPHEAMPRAEAAAMKSMELDESLPDAHSALGLVRHHYHWDWKGAEQSYRRAIELNPNYAAAHLWFSWLLLALGRFDEAFRELEETLDIVQETDPDRLVAVLATRAAAYYFNRQYDRAIQECRTGMDLNPNYFMLHYILGRCMARMDMNTEAIEQLKPKGFAPGEVPLMDAALGLAYSVAGKPQQTKKIIESFNALARKRYIPATYFGMLYAGIGDREEALNWLEKAYEERADGLTWINIDPMMDDIKQNPRFQSLIQKIGLVKS